MKPFSYAAHPIFVPLVATLWYLYALQEALIPAQMALVLLQVLILTVILPLCAFLLLRAADKAHSIMLSEVGQRKRPLLLQLGFMAMLVWRSIKVDYFPELHFFFLGAIWSTAIAYLLTFIKFKTSLHLMALGGLLGFVIGLSAFQLENNLPVLAGLFVLTGLVAASRLEMQAHDVKEVLTGWIIGLLPQLILLPLWS